MQRRPFDQGGMRIVHRATEVLADGTEIDAVVKRFKPEINRDPEINFHEAMTQMVAESYAQDFNRACSNAGLPCRVAFLPVSVVKLEGTAETMCLEPYLAGDYVKHSDNTGHNETEDEVAAAFSYFTYVNSNKLLVVCDIQGVGTFYTDPQIHTFDGAGFGAGNLGRQGIDAFLRTHTHSLVCDRLGLPSLDAGLTDEELARKLQEVEDRAEGMPWDPFYVQRAGLAGGIVGQPVLRSQHQYRSGLQALAQLLQRW